MSVPFESGRLGRIQIQILKTLSSVQTSVHQSMVIGIDGHAHHLLGVEKIHHLVASSLAKEFHSSDFSWKHPVDQNVTSNNSQ